MCVCVCVCVRVCVSVSVYVCVFHLLFGSFPYQEAELCPVNNTICGDNGACSVQNNQRTCICLRGTSIYE